MAELDQAGDCEPGEIRGDVGLMGYCKDHEDCDCYAEEFERLQASAKAWEAEALLREQNRADLQATVERYGAALADIANWEGVPRKIARRALGK